jgi:hypothetical protein
MAMTGVLLDFFAAALAATWTWIAVPLVVRETVLAWAAAGS